MIDVDTEAAKAAGALERRRGRLQRLQRWCGRRYVCPFACLLDEDGADFCVWAYRTLVSRREYEQIVPFASVRCFFSIFCIFLSE